MSRRSSHLFFWLLLVLGLACGVGLAEDEKGSDSDSVVSDVLRMLEGGVSSPAIVEWLNRQETPIPSLTPEEMIRLSEAGASYEVMRALNRMSSPASAPGPSASPPAHAPPAPATAPPTPPSVAPPETTNAGKAGVLFSLKYKRSEDTGEAYGMFWKLFVYLDGEPVTYSRSQSSFVDETIETFRWMPPGRHVIRLLHESHVKRGKRGIVHETRVCPDPIIFDVEPGDGWRLELTYLEKTFAKRSQGPLTWSLKKGPEPVAGRNQASVSVDDWPTLCEDLQANVPEGKKTPSWVKRKLEGCVHWETLWEGIDSWPDRTAVLAALEEQNFEPPRN